MLLTNNTIIVATKNQGKIKEFTELFNKLNIIVQSLADYNCLPEIVEDGRTFAENAEKKAKTIGVHLQIPVLADDSGLCVDVLDGQPGIYSARYAGMHATDQMNNEKLLANLKQNPSRLANELLSPAKFVCALALFDPQNGHTLHAEGICPGYITAESRGKYGFGYDPLFFLPQFGKTMAELRPAIKNQISHRSAALQKLFELLT